MPDNEMADALYCTAAVILIDMWQMRAQPKAHDPEHWFGLSSADRVIDSVFKPPRGRH